MAVLLQSISVNFWIAIALDEFPVVMNEVYLYTLYNLHTTCICSAQSGNLRNLEIALRILRIRKLRTNLEIAQWVYAISRLRSTSAQSRDRTAPVRNLEIAQSRDSAISVAQFLLVSSDALTPLVHYVRKLCSCNLEIAQAYCAISRLRKRTAQSQD